MEFGRIALFPDAIPERQAQVEAGQVDFEAALLGPARALNDHRRALEFEGLEAEHADVAHLFAKHLGHEVFGLGALDGQRRDIGLADFDIQVERRGKAQRPQLDIAVSDREPEVVGRQAQRDGVVDHPALSIAEGSIVAAPRHRVAQITRGHEAGELVGVLAFQFDLTLGGHVPDLHMLLQVRAVFGQRSKGCGQQHVVIGGVGAETRGFDPRAVGGLADAPGGKNREGSHGVVS